MDVSTALENYFSIWYHWNPPTRLHSKLSVKWLRVKGMWPLNPNTFDDDEYLSSYVTDRPQPENPVNEP